MARTPLDADRLAAAYERDARRILVFFTRRTYDARFAVDLVAETYARAFEQRRRFAADARDRDALAAWVFGTPTSSAAARRCGSTPALASATTFSPSPAWCPTAWRPCI
jgi:DNA-directed RNA polymerase specialized sigma24 family protein